MDQPSPPPAAGTAKRPNKTVFENLLKDFIATRMPHVTLMTKAEWKRSPERKVRREAVKAAREEFYGLVIEMLRGRNVA